MCRRCFSALHDVAERSSFDLEARELDAGITDSSRSGGVDS